MLILDCIPEERGWSPIRHMVSLAGELLGAEILAVGHGGPTIAEKLSSLLLRRRRGSDESDESCLMMCAGPGELAKVLTVAGWRKRFSFLAAWIIDSFWLEHISIFTRTASPFDHFFVTSLEDIDQWRRATGISTTWLPWGADALRLGRCAATREWDLTRVGRQPEDWEDDAESAKLAASLGIRFRGRPPSPNLTTLQNQRFLMEVYGDTKYVLAFSNSVNHERYTHPTRQYLTGRWVDALSCGATVAGIAPRGETVSQLLWPDATLDFSGVRRSEGLPVLAAALKDWTPARARHNYRMALRNLDWRWRFKTLCDHFGIAPAPLAAELAQLKDRISSNLSTQPAENSL